ncbi:SpoIIAA family protein [Sphingosinicella rhizophila]|uniref:STAS/SEC14 domain-containing protein n=1 Tax=Sphingosinicella rhizophila TaxID=3050082 RepID=A0ABU3QBD9_9SPHN|nr:STAS/SEC14 domain-containing protein [Sphingosinicella sp. GR2756]MDT9600698.1 STAS/SEC14 domain-containing protein [Sphingosinicella sp. GR2756]
MLEFIDTTDEVIAFCMSGKIESADLDRVMDRLDAAMAAHDRVHVFAETQGIDGIELHGLGNYMSRAMPLFAKLDRFGRVAVVADQAWIRLGTRVESAVLPFISYKVFEPERRAAALAWVEGRGEAG